MSPSASDKKAEGCKFSIFLLLNKSLLPTSIPYFSLSLLKVKFE